MLQASVRAGGRGPNRLQTSRKWRCCYVGWLADQTQDLQGWDFFQGSPLQLDIETAVKVTYKVLTLCFLVLEIVGIK